MKKILIAAVFASFANFFVGTRLLPTRGQQLSRAPAEAFWCARSRAPFCPVPALAGIPTFQKTRVFRFFVLYTASQNDLI